MIHKWLCLVIAAGCAATTPAQTLEVTGIQGGTVFDSQGSTLRSILGVPGSAFVADSVASNLTAAWPSPNGHYAVVIQGAQTFLLNRRDPLYPNLVAAPVRVSWNRSGTAAAVYSQSEAALQCVEPSQVHPPHPIPFVSGDVAALAIDNCTTIALAAGTHVYLLTKGVIKTILDVSASALAFGPNGLYVATTEGVLEFRDGAARLVFEQRAIAALAISSRGQLVVLADRMVAIRDQHGMVVSELALDRAASMLRPLTNSTFLLHDLAENAPSITVLDISQHEPAVFFVPVAPRSYL